MDPLSAIGRAIRSRGMSVARGIVSVAIAAVAVHRFQATALAPVATVAPPPAVDPAQRAYLDELEQALREVAKQPPKPISPEGLRAVAERWAAPRANASRPFEPQHVDGAPAAARDRNAPPRTPHTREEMLRFASDIRPFLVSP